MAEKTYGDLMRPYRERSVSARIEALFADNLGKVLTREQIIQAATDPSSGKEPENWHQRMSELRTDKGYTILSHRDRADLRPGEYLMLDASRRPVAAKRVQPSREAWKIVLRRADNTCEWREAGERCGLADGEIDSVGGGTVRLTPDHKQPHSVDPASDPGDPDQWQALCGRHQVIKKNYWDSTTGKMNVYAVVQAATHREKAEVLEFLLRYFGYSLKA